MWLTPQPFNSPFEKVKQKEKRVGVASDDASIEFFDYVGSWVVVVTCVTPPTTTQHRFGTVRYEGETILYNCILHDVSLYE